MHCPTCGAAVSAEMKICSTCNSTLEAPAAAAKAPRKRRSKAADEAPSPLVSQRAAAEAMLDAFLRDGGLDPAKQTDEDGTRYIQFGSVMLHVDILESNEILYVRAVAPVMEIPSDKDLIVPLMRKLLELNLYFAGSQRFGMTAKSVICMGIRRVDDMQPDELASLLFGVMHVADELDDQLQARFGGTSKQRSA